MELEIGRQHLAANTFLQVKYRFLDEEPRRRFRTLLFRIVHRLQAITTGATEQEIWEQFLHTNDPPVAQLDEADFPKSGPHGRQPGRGGWGGADDEAV